MKIFRQSHRFSSLRKSSTIRSDQMIIPHSRPTISKRDMDSVARNLLSGQIASRKEVGLFEKEMSSFIGVRMGVAANSGTNALHLALKALGIKSGDEVVLPTYVCASVLSAVNYTGATPVLADIEPGGYNISPESVEEKLSKKTKAIIVPHMFGIPANLDRLLKIDVPLIEDCAQAIGAEYKGKKLGSLGDLSIFSFYATKVLTTGHGGMALANSPQLLDRFADLTKYDEREGYAVSYNYEMADFAAALGRSQLRQLDSFIRRRNEIAKIYDDAFERIGMDGRTNRDGICFRYVVEVDNPDKYIEAMKKCGVNCAKPVFRPLHKYFGKCGEFPNAERAMSRAISVPIYPSLNDEEISRICKSINRVWANGSPNHMR
ncbi:UDP-4-amino-4-deoxy-L-arabinose--oxoglutarate aminotransferase [uncultured archaeon]|nr:UDP-4-amino-4-deoxy-L-arabinose--oxoglutarate aminotransferase [uncultured archaeon]